MTRLGTAFAFVAAACLAASALAQPGRPAEAKIDPQALSVAQEIVELAYPPEGRRAMFMGTMDSLMAQMRAASAEVHGGRIDPGAEAILDRFFERLRARVQPAIDEASPALFAAYARAYARQFSRDELLQIRAFVATPAGAKYTQRSPALLADPDVAAANTAYISRTLAIVQPLQAEVREELTEYYKTPQR
ncbi:MAG: hypothetical protein QOJ91_1552 [Sphingomonadales bacterium]|jgi:hypothetical protein|nr:hypothetical protein [Sphingomonadales bacterium]